MAIKFYGSVNNETKLAVKFYGGVNGGAEKITKLYGSANGEAKLIHQSFGHNKYMQTASYQITDNVPPYEVKTPDLIASIDDDVFVDRCNAYSPVSTKIQGGNIFSTIVVWRNSSGRYRASYYMTPSGGGDICYWVNYANAVSALSPWGITLKSDPGDSNEYVDRIIFETTYS